jgi:enamine deaminase RidA (YjgF/YER057c/UK114 family)
MKQALAEWCPDVPCTEIVCACAGFGGAIVHAVTGAQTSRLCVPGGGGGSRVDFTGGRQVILCGLQARDKAAPPAAQAGDVLAQIVPALSAEGLDLADTVRTWFFNSKILDWYLPFNATRTTHFLSHGVLRMPASTGVGAENSASSALTAKLIALRFRDSGGTIAEAESPLQCHAFSYGSAFSRGLCVSTAAWRTLHVSGTAAIEPDGKSAHPGDPAAQIEMTLQVLEALLEKSGMALGQTTRAIAYFPEPAHAPLLAEALARRGLYEFPYLVVPATICRPDLLFEMELDAAAHAQISGDFFRHQPILKHAK